MTGWIKLHRKILDWEWYRDGNTFRLFVHLLLNANRSPQRWQGITIEREQLIVGRKSLSEQTGLSERAVRTALNRLKTTNEIIVKTTNRYSIITISNYDAYQSSQIIDDQQTTSK